METLTATETVTVTNLDVSLDDRIAASKAPRAGRRDGAGGPRRSGGAKEGRKARSSGGLPYSKDLAPYKRGNSDTAWKHDLFGPAVGIAGGELGARLSGAGTGAPGGGAAGGGKGASGRAGKVDFSGVKGLLSRGEALGGAAGGGGGKGLSVRGAGAGAGKVVRVDNLMEGTTAADVEAIFKDAGSITSSRLVRSKPTVSVELSYVRADDAQDAVRRFDGQTADGLTLKVFVVGGGGAANGAGGGGGGAGLISRLGARRGGGDLLGEDDGGSKMRSDALLDAPGAQVVGGDAFSGGGTGGGRARGGGRWRRGGGRA